MRSKAWLAACASLRLARLPRTASIAQRSRRLRSTRAAAPVLLAHAEVTANIMFFTMGPTLTYPTRLMQMGSDRVYDAECATASSMGTISAGIVW